MWPGRDPALRLGLLLPVRPPVRGGPASIDKPLVPEQVIGTTFTPAMPRKEDGQPDDRSGRAARRAIAALAVAPRPAIRLGALLISLIGGILLSL